MGSNLIVLMRSIFLSSLIIVLFTVAFDDNGILVMLYIYIFHKKPLLSFVVRLASAITEALLLVALLVADEVNC